MSKSDSDIIKEVKELIDTRIQPAVSAHGGIINFISYENGNLMLELSGACAGCAGSTATLKNGVERMVKNFIPEITSVDAVHDQNSGVSPYYSDEDGRAHWKTMTEVNNDTDS